MCIRDSVSPVPTAPRVAPASAPAADVPSAEEPLEVEDGALEPLETAPAEADELAEGAEEAQELPDASGDLRRYFETQLHALPADERVARARRWTRS